MTNTTSSAGESLAQRIIAKIFADHFKPGLYEVAFRREELVTAAEALGEPRPKNLGDIVYSLRYRVPLPDSVREAAPPNTEWADLPRRERGLCVAGGPIQSHRAPSGGPHSPSS